MSDDPTEDPPDDAPPEDGDFAELPDGEEGGEGEIDDPFAELGLGGDEERGGGGSEERDAGDRTSGSSGRDGSDETDDAVALPDRDPDVPDAGDGGSGSDPAAGAGTDEGGAGPDLDDAGPDDVDDPFAALGEADEELAEEAFDRMEVDELDEEEVWSALAEGEPAVEGDARPVEDETRDHVVDKREYCQRCPHLSEPPDVECTHEDGRIVEVLPGDEFRVRDCPMVTEEGPRFDRGGGEGG